MALIKKPTSSALPLIARLVEVPRLRWSPYVDPRLEAAAESLAPHLAQFAESEDWAALVAAIRHVLDGERDEDALAAGLDEIDRAILHRILVEIADSAGGGAIDG